MAWVEASNVNNEAIVLEQGIDSEIIFEMFEDDAKTQAWPFPFWDVNAVLSDEKQRSIHTLTTVLDAVGGVITVIVPEAVVNALKTTKNYVIDVLMVAPGNILADDHHLAYLPATVAPRPARRDP